jgi:hypothetical protein
MTEDRFGFARALSLARPDVPIAYKDLHRLAREVLRSDRPGLAMDQASDPLREAMDELEETLNRTVPNARDRQAVFDMCARVAGAARDAASAPQGGMEMLEATSAATRGGPSNQERNFGNASDRRRMASDAGPGPLDALFAEFPPAARPFG